MASPQRRVAESRAPSRGKGRLRHVAERSLGATGCQGPICAGGSSATTMIRLAGVGRGHARVGVSKIAILVVDHPFVDPPGGRRAERLRSVQDFLRCAEGAKAAALADVLVLVDRAELLDIPELLAAFVENVMDGQPVSTVAVTPGGQPPKLGRPATQSVPSNCWMPLPRRSAHSAKFTVR